jgi:excisionase family DNA binding protein
MGAAHPLKTLSSRRAVRTVIITTAEAARRLGVSRERVRRLLEQGAAGFRIEGRARPRYVDLEGEWTENDRVLLSIQEAARRFGMSTSTIRRWIEKGRLESFRLEGDRRVYVAMD